MPWSLIATIPLRNARRRGAIVFALSDIDDINNNRDDTAMNVLIELIEVRQDARGIVFNPVGRAPRGEQKSTHVAVTEPGCVRGNHYHTRATETLAIVGPWLIRYRENGK